MPTLLRWKGYRFFFFSADGSDVHVERDGCQVKIWLADLTIAINIGFKARELSEIARQAREEREVFVGAWNDFFRNIR